MDTQQQLKIAIACPGIGLVQRGFERYFADLFSLMADEYAMTLFKGGGKTRHNEKILPFVYRNGLVAKIFPVHKLFGRNAMHTECLTFAMALLWQIRKNNYDIVHCIDPPLARVLYKLRHLFGMRFKLLYTEGCAMPPQHYPPADHIHQVALQTAQDAVAFGVPERHMALVPCGINPEKFACSKSKAELRQAYGIAADTFVILSVAALNRGHKRMHHLIGEAASLQGNFLLWLDSSLDQGEPDLIALAKSSLGDRCRLTHVPSDKVGELYALADVFVHTATAESFGLAIVEAAASGLPVITHDSGHFRWLLQNTACHVDMTVDGALCSKLAGLMAHPEAMQAMRCPVQVRQRFDWRNLKAAYRSLYEGVAGIEIGKMAR